jgi:molybdopterin molybdotransferase
MIKIGNCRKPEVIDLLKVKTPKEAAALINETFGHVQTGLETVPLNHAVGRVVAKPIMASEYIPGFNRSTVDGYAVYSADTFGCSESMPALLTLSGEVLMGIAPPFLLSKGACMAIPTGGALPDGADAVVMLEYAENYQDGTIGILKPVAPGGNLIFKGDDVRPGARVMNAGRKLYAHDIGALAALGVSLVPVAACPVVGVISTGNELVEITSTPQDGQVRDVNSWLLEAAIIQAGGIAQRYGAVADNEDQLLHAVKQVVKTCDLVLISGGSSVGTKDITLKTIASLGEILFHGISVKPGKPTIVGNLGGKPVFGLPGHPVAAHFIFESFVRPLIQNMLGVRALPLTIRATLLETVPSNHGKEEYLPVRLADEANGLFATPIRGKSGLITTLLETNGYLRIPRDCEGIAAGTLVDIILYSNN